MEDDNIAIRLKGFIQSQGLTHSQFADSCGIARPSLSQLLGGRNKKISDVLVGQIHKAYPELSVLWLMFGEGKMLVDLPKGETVSGPKEGAASSGESEIGRNGIYSAEMFDDDSVSQGGQTELNVQSNVRPLNRGINKVENKETQRVDGDIKVVEMMRQIEKMRKNPRKVSQITVYYDDSTFETFYPKR